MQAPADNHGQPRVAAGVHHRRGTRCWGVCCSLARDPRYHLSNEHVVIGMRLDVLMCGIFTQYGTHNLLVGVVPNMPVCLEVRQGRASLGRMPVVDVAK